MKDAKGHGSNARGEGSVNTVFSSKQGVGGLGRGMYAKLQSGQTVKLNPAATGGKIPSVGDTLDAGQHTVVGGGAQAHVARIAQAHGIQGGPIKVQSLSLNRVGQPWATQKSFRNRTVAETVAKGMRTDGGYTRVKIR